MAGEFRFLSPYDASVTTADSIEQLRFYSQNQFQQIAEAFLLMNSDYREFLVHAGYGNASLSVAQAIPNITAAFQTLPLDASLADSRDVDYNLANDAIIFETEGVWRVSINFVMEFTDTAAGRTFQMRVWNLTDGTVITAVPVFVGRNQEGTNFSFQAVLDLGQITIGDEIVVQVGQASTTFAGVTLEANRIDVNRISEVKD